jgi:Lamin Tail Domain
MDDAIVSPDIRDGAVLIREALVNPAGTDRGNEWITLFNNTDKVVDLAGWTIKDSLKRSESLQGSSPPHSFKSNLVW